MNLDTMEFTINSMELPIRVMNGKSIDDILINGNELLLVDNMIFPKYLIKYDISVPITPMYIDTIGLQNNGTYEHIIKGDMNNDWLILLSSTIGMDGSFQYITITGKTEGLLSVDGYSNIDIALIKNKLFVLSSDGLWYIDLNKRISEEYFKPIHASNDSDSPYSSKIKRIIKSKSMDLIACYENGYEVIV